MPKPLRQGPLGAFMDEYERAAEELKNILRTIALKDYVAIVDSETDDPDCTSIQTIMNHVVKAGFGYANYIRQQFGDFWIERKEQYELPTPKLAIEELDKMLFYTVETLTNKWDLNLDDVIHHKIKSRWGQEYDLEQLLEHAIVHILRHRRQIEKFLGQLQENNLH